MGNSAPRSLASRPGQNVYDAVVVGSGLGGLSVAGLLAKEGKHTLVIERQDGPGGCAHAFERGPYIFDPAVHVMGQGKDGQLVDSLLRHLGVRDQCTLLPIDPFYSALLPDFEFQPPNGIAAYAEAHAALFPHEAAGLRTLYRTCGQIHDDAHHLPPQLGLNELDAAALRFPTLFKYLRATLADLMDEFLVDARTKSVVAANWVYLGLPPSKLSAVTFAQLLSTYGDGLVFCRGGFQELANALVTGVERHGGEIIVNRQVQRILIEEGQVVGVELDDGTAVRAPLVVSNADALQTLEDLVGIDHLPAPYVRRLQRMAPTVSGFVLFAATTMDVRPYLKAHETFIYKHWDHEQTYQDVLAGVPGGIWINAPTMIDSSLAPAGEHLVIVSCMAPYDVGVPWSEARDRYTEALLDEAAAILPGLRDHLTFVESATPETLQKFSLNYQGALYGWDHTPTQIGGKRLGNVTPVGGLFLSGHWTQPGGGSLRVLASGVQTASIIMGRPVLPF